MIRTREQGGLIWLDGFLTTEGQKTQKNNCFADYFVSGVI